MPTDDELYTQVVVQGRRLRRRRRVLLGSSAAVAVVVVALVAVGLVGGDDGGGEAVVADGSDVSESSTTTSSTVAVTSSTTETTETTVVAEPVPSTTTMTTEPEPPPLVCRNSRDPACGDFYWDPVPPNQPITLTVSAGQSIVAVGQPVMITIEGHDPEAEVLIVSAEGHGNVQCHIDWGDDPGYPPGCLRTAELRTETPPRTGPWDPPPPVGASASGTATHTYDAPGTYAITVYALALTSEAVRNSHYDVYTDHATATVTVTVV